MNSDFNIITVTGFGATGSSAISHIISEFDNVKSLGSTNFGCFKTFMEYLTRLFFKRWKS